MTRTMIIVNEIIREIAKMINNVGAGTLEKTIDYADVMKRYDVGLNTARAILKIVEKKLIEMGVDAKFERGKLWFKIEKEDLKSVKNHGQR